MDVKTHLILWDIDHTLIFAGHVDHAVWIDACSRVSGRRVTTIGDVPGRTEPQILLDAMVLAGVPEERAHSLLPAAIEMAVDALGARRAELRSRGRALPGAEATLAAMSDMPGVTQSLVTGNLKSNAVLKLQTFGLDRYLDLDVGAYGSDDIRREALVRLARARAGAHLSMTFDRSNTVVVGDSPLDVTAGEKGGARSVAVATGTSSRAALVEAGADMVLDDLADLDTSLMAILDRCREVQIEEDLHL